MRSNQKIAWNLKKDLVKVPHAFGMEMNGRKWQGTTNNFRFSYNGKESASELASGDYDFGERILDGRVGKWMTWDPLRQKYPNVSPYIFGLNNPNVYLDSDGNEIVDANGKKVEVKTYEVEKGIYKVDFKFQEGTDQSTKDAFYANAGTVIKAMSQSEIGREVVKNMNEVTQKVSIELDNSGPKWKEDNSEKLIVHDTPGEGRSPHRGQTVPKKNEKGEWESSKITIFKGTIDKIKEDHPEGGNKIHVVTFSREESETGKEMDVFQSDYSAADIIGAIGVHEGTHATDKNSSRELGAAKPEAKPNKNELKHYKQREGTNKKIYEKK